MRRTMKHRHFNFAVTVSAISLCLIVIAWSLSSWIDPRNQFVSLSSGCHISIDARGADARLEVFNDSNYGPYAGSIIGSGPDGPTVSGFGDVAGIYYRMIRWRDGTSLWTLSLSLMYPLLVAAILPVVWLVRQPHRPPASNQIAQRNL